MRVPSSSSSKLRAPGLRLSVEQLEELAPIGKRIRENWDLANCKAALARSSGAEAVKAALLCGDALNEAKGRLRHGEWLAWLERHCGDVARSITTAQNWMRLARVNNQGFGFLEEASSLTVAYRMVGILPALPEREGGEGTLVTLEQVSGRLAWLRRQADAVASWSEEQKRKLADELRPLIELYHQLIPEAKGA